MLKKIYVAKSATHKESQRTLPALDPCTNSSVYLFEDVLAPIGAGCFIKITCVERLPGKFLNGRLGTEDINNKLGLQWTQYYCYLTVLR